MKSRLAFFILFFFTVYLACAQIKTVTGIVTDDNNDPLPGVSIVIKNTTNGTSTDFDGNYTIDVTDGDILVFSYVGFTTQEINTSGKMAINVQLVSGVEL